MVKPQVTGCLFFATLTSHQLCSSLPLFQHNTPSPTSTLLLEGEEEAVFSTLRV